MQALVIDDETNIRKILIRLLDEHEIKSHESSLMADSLVALESNQYDVVFVDLRLPDGSGLDILKAIKQSAPETIVLIITAFASTETAIEAMKAGAYDYMTKPFNIDEVRIVLRNIVERINLHERVRELQQYADEYQSIVGKSEAIQRVFGIVDKIAPFDSNILIVGESGTGKELVAKAIHQKSRRKDRLLVAINCASLPGELLESELFGYAKGAFTGAYSTRSGLIEQANGGTLFLDEIGEMPLSLQAKLLRFLEDKKIRPLGSGQERDVDVRVVAATNRSVREMLSTGAFREDLFYRLATFEIPLPSLRERREDIPLLVAHFVKLFARKFEKKIDRIAPEFMDYVMHHELRGNVRELKNLIEREVILAEQGVLKSSAKTSSESVVTKELLPRGGFMLDEYLAGIEYRLLQEALSQASGVKTQAAKLLGLTFREFRYRIAKYRPEESSISEPDVS